jgi:hypothetical protein
MCLDPGARAAVLKVALPFRTLALSRMLPLLRSVNVTKLPGTPLGLVTLAVKVTHVSRATVFLVTVSVVVVRALACGDADA